jgi:hypothetical protein
MEHLKSFVSSCVWKSVICPLFARERLNFHFELRAASDYGGEGYRSRILGGFYNIIGPK